MHVCVEPKWLFSFGEGDGSIIGVYPGEYYTWGLCNLVVNSGIHISPLEASALCSKTSFPEDKVS